MQKIVIDTNVLVSALIQRNYPFFILQEIFENNNIEHCVSKALFKEYYNVLNREKFSKFPNFVSNAKMLLVSLEEISVMYHPKIKLNIIKDADDNKLLELAETCKSDLLITGNTKDFTFPAYKKTKIVSPKEYWTEHLIR